MSDVKLAVLILAHRDVSHLNRLIRKLQHPDIKVFVHVDVKCGSFYRSEISDDAHVLPQEACFDISWGGMEMVYATVSLLRCAAARGSFSHYALISGQDYLVKSAQELITLLGENDGDYLTILPDELRFTSRYTLYFPNWLLGKQPWKRPVRAAYKIVGAGLLPNIFLRSDCPASRFHCGQQWWLLRSGPVEWMLGEMERDSGWFTYFSHSQIPDEGFFQTLYCVSPFSGSDLGNLTYADWSGNGPSPEILSERHFEEIVLSGKFFARKMDSEISKTLLEKIDRLRGASVGEAANG